MRALELFKQLGATKGRGICEDLLHNIDQAMKGLSTSGELDSKFQW
jgi:hypothetical protein